MLLGEKFWARLAHPLRDKAVLSDHIPNSEGLWSSKPF